MERLHILVIINPRLKDSNKKSQFQSPHIGFSVIYLFVYKSHEILSVLTNCIAQVVMCHVMTNNIVSSSCWKILQISEILTIVGIEGEIKINNNINKAFILNKAED